jgi:hypothetical protein
MSTMVSSHVFWFVALTCAAGVASAQTPPDPALIDMAAKLESGQSIVRGDSKVTLQQHDASTKASSCVSF